MVELDEYAPLERTTEPVGVPLAPDTATVTPRLCAVVTLAEAGETLTLAVANACVTVTVAVPLELLYAVELPASGV